MDHRNDTQAFKIGVTMNIYSHVMPTQLVQAADEMEKVLWARGGNRGYSLGYFRPQERQRASVMSDERPGHQGWSRGDSNP